ncbi:DUF4344 domain-containing metallopeptidase [Deinococcus cellulosilyticus]|uniref:Uncharacterized protein n=1 Tax=Deinococcus cellulosilyticus (strain DSM 18568 / NBRC 106333 / KACC 11606 / 5516J-15) TaxID=1223518 RepID=A0A511N3T1_DEIC1|nr:DUF4344 domain-containing metallopeptidase [Deinococcus cellulosilyticus]GEM47495.1 hypothetical protein DC3_31300 [Deinococcus cellulosilyticus NBRC 106333 = KACC 11606]
MAFSRWSSRILLLLALGTGSASAQLVLTFDKGKTKTHQSIQQVLSKSQYLTDVTAYFNDQIKFPRKLKVHFLSCNEDNAYYNPDRPAIEMCYELVQTYSKLEEKGTSKEDKMLNATVFTLLHELGHALIDQLRLPATGREEDAVDQFATLALLSLEDEPGIYSGLHQFLSDAELEEEGDLDFSDSHSLNMQRMYDMACLVYGSNPKKFKTIPKEYDLPKERSSNCQEEHEDARYAWNTILRPFLKSPKKGLL